MSSERIMMIFGRGASAACPVEKPNPLAERTSDKTSESDLMVDLPK